MRFYDAELEPWSDGFREIYVDDEYTYSGWWASSPDGKYNYTRDKSEEFFSAAGYICQYLGGEIEAFAGSRLYALKEDKYGFSKYDRYVELVEFGWNCYGFKPYEIIEYFIKYARYVGAKFIRVSTKEDFHHFYSLISQWVDEVFENDCYIINIDDPIVYDEFIHIKHYDTDYVTVEDLYFLYYMGYTIERDACRLDHYTGEKVFIDRKTGVITFPSYVWHESEEQTVLSPRYYPLIYLFNERLHDIKSYTLMYDVKIDGIDFDFARIGNDRLVLFHEFEWNEDMFDVVYKISKATDYERYSLFTASINPDDLFPHAMSCDRKISKDLYQCGLCLDIDGYCSIPPHEKVLEDGEFNKRLAKIKSFGLILDDKYNPLKEAYIFFKPSVATINYGGKMTELKIEKRKIIRVLQMAHFCNWESEYIGQDMELSWGVTLELEDETISFRGKNKAPNAWRYFINELTEGLKIDEI